MAAQRDGELGLWMNGSTVGTWRVVRGRHQLSYSPEWFDSAEGRPVSLSLPLIPPGEMHEGDRVEAFFENLLPEDAWLRRVLAQRFGANGTRALDLLAHVGRDAAGALQLLPPAESPGDIRRITGKRLDEAAVAAHLRSIRGHAGSMAHRGLRISLAGAHAKTALLWRRGGWHEPTGPTPSTHILKPPLGRVGGIQADLSESVENEWLCARIAEAFGLPTPPSRIEQFEDQKVLVVERFDRRLAADGSWLLRLPQEDACQALGVPPDRKYESDGGPGIRAMMELLVHSSNGEDDRRTFFTTQVLFWMLAATDGHAKKFSIAIEAGGRFHLTPLYDIVSALPVMGRGPHLIEPREARLAMALWGTSRHDRLAQIQRRHFASTAEDCRLAGGSEPIVRDLLADVPRVVAEVTSLLPPGFPSSVAEPILHGLAERATLLEAMPPG